MKDVSFLIQTCLKQIFVLFPLQMKIECTFSDDAGQKRSCIHADETNMLPIYIGDADQCNDKKILARIEMKMCNNNEWKTIKPKFKDENKRPKFMFDGEIIDDATFIDYNKYDSQILKKSCKVYTFDTELDTCRSDIKIQVMLKGRSNQEPCYGYLERSIYMSTFISPPEVVPTAAPTPAPTMAPTAPVQQPVTPNPTPQPNVPEPLPENCDPRDALITEVASPAGSPESRFVEIFFEDCAGKVIKDDIYIVRWPSEGAPVKETLYNYLVPPDGFVVVCSDSISPSGTCDFLNSSVGNNDGTDAVAVTEGPEPSTPDHIIDIYGQPTADDVTIEPFDFSNGRGVRIKNPCPNPTNEFDIDEWMIYPGDDKAEVGPRGIDPGVWVDPLIITEVSDPLDGDEITAQDYADVPRFIEIMVPNDDRWGQEKVSDDLKLVLFHGDSEHPDFSTVVPLSDVDIPQDGFIVVCNDAADSAFTEVISGETKYLCDLVVSELFDDREGNFGCDRAAIIHGDSVDDYTIVDMFGSLAVACDQSQHDFTGGKGVRLTNSTYPEPTWNVYHWEIMLVDSPENSGPRGFDWPAGPCNPRDALITEVANPTGASGRYVEIYFDDCAGRTIKDDIHVVRWPRENDASPLTTALRGFMVPLDGFVLVCAGEDISPTGTCDFINDNVGNNDGQDAVAVVEGPDYYPDEFEVIDIYGVKGASLDEVEAFDFQGGRGVRIKMPYPESNSEFDIEEWNIYPGADKFLGVGEKGTDPRVWVKPIIITEIIDPITGTEETFAEYAAVPRFIEMVVPNSDRWGEEKVGDGLNLVLFHGDSADPDFTTIVSLEDVDIPVDGFIVVCNTAAETFYKDTLTFHQDDYKCDLVISELFDDREGNFGCDRAAIVHGDSVDKYSIVDMYGTIGVPCGDSAHDFTGGRGVRLTNSTYAEPTWNVYHCEVTKDASPSDGDPRNWVDPPLNLFIKEVADPPGDKRNRHIVLKSPNKNDYEIDDDYWLVVSSCSGFSDSDERLSLDGFEIDTDGLLSFCAKGNTLAADECDYELDSPSILTSLDGQDVVAITYGDWTLPPNVVDILGYPGDCEKEVDFTNGAAVRIDEVTGPRDPFDPAEWIISAPDPDPGPDPQPDPAPTPTMAPHTHPTTDHDHNNQPHSHTHPTLGPHTHPTTDHDHDNQPHSHTHPTLSPHTHTPAPAPSKDHDNDHNTAPHTHAPAAPSKGKGSNPPSPPKMTKAPHMTKAPGKGARRTRQNTRRRYAQMHGGG